MKNLNKHIIFILALLFAFYSNAQENIHKGYRIEGDFVVFTFNIDDYEYLTNEKHQTKLDVSELDIESVAVAGEFNMWSRNLWQMTKIDNDTYEFRKKITDFSDEFDWEFKFVINDIYWAEPSYKDPNISNAVSESGYSLDVYNLRMFTAFPDKNGNVRFRLKGYENANKVIVSGSFNKWDENLFRMYKIEGGWEIILNLRPDEYQYRFIVDGEWMEDPTNPDKKENEFGEYNSHINVKKYIEFKLKGFENADKVILTGTFNNWNEQEYIMKKTKNGYWSFSIPLSRGKYYYKFIVNDKWILDPVNTVKEYDSEGNVNSVCMVK